MSNFKINVCETQKQKGGGNFSPDNIANYKTLIRRFFADYGTEACLSKIKNYGRQIMFFIIMAVVVFLFCEFGESAI